MWYNLDYQRPLTARAKDGSFRGLFGHPNGATGPLRVGINRTGRERRQMVSYPHFSECQGF